MNRRIYVDLDSLLDTRAGLLSLIDEEQAVDTIMQPAYYVRKSNDFGFVDGKTFNERFRKRGNEVLEHAPVTRMTTKLNEFVEEILATPAYQYSKDKLSLLVNIYPYTMTDDEKLELEAIMMYYTNQLIPIEIVSMGLDWLTPSHFKAQYDLVIMYDWGLWVAQHGAQLANDRLNEVTFFVPRIFFESELTEEQLREEGFESSDKMLDFAEMVLSSSMGLEMCDIRLWCNLPPNAAPYESRREQLENSKPIN